MCDSLERTNRDFVWGASEEQRKLHSISWKHFVKSKKEGGMGFKDICPFRVLLGAPNIFAGAPSNLGERAKIPFTLSYKSKQ